MVIEPGIPGWARRAFLRLSEEFVPLIPTAPTGVFSAPTTALTAGLAARYPGTIAYDTTLGSLVYSNGSAWV